MTTRITAIRLSALVALCLSAYVSAKISYQSGDHSWALENKILLESFGGKNLNLLNDCNVTRDGRSLDRVITPIDHTWDMRLMYGYGAETYGNAIASATVGFRSKGTGGASDKVGSTKDSDFKLIDVKTGSHKHEINAHAITLRELEIAMQLNQLFGVSLDPGHTFKMGYFPYQLGRGIALGVAYQVTPDLIGYKPIDSVQQFAPGFELYGPVFSDLNYDFYGAILENKSHSFSVINEKTRGQEIGHLNDPYRGSGVFNYLFAGRFTWTPINNECAYVYFEPYGLYNRQDEQKVEFAGDAALSLGTVGLAHELRAGNFEFGFDVAFNDGEQHVKAWDRNEIKFENFGVANGNDGVPHAVNSEVKEGDLLTSGKIVFEDKAPYRSGTPDQEAIFRQAQFATQASDVASLNGTFKKVRLGINPTTGSPVVRTSEDLKNSQKRFRNAYTNELEGSMFVCDAAYHINPCLKFAVSGGFSSGDENPNRDLNQRGESEQDGVFRGFIGLQEIYNGKRVRSYMVMSGFGRFPRVTSFPNVDEKDQFDNRFADRVSRFTNLEFVGTALWWKPETEAGWQINPNLLSFWQHNTTKIFDPQINERGEQDADDHLGVEANVAIEGYPITNMKFFAIGGVFAPGDHYDDIKGRPINKDQQDFLDRKDPTGFEAEPQPLLGNDAGWFINTGFEYRF